MTLANLEILAFDNIRDADAALQHLAALSKLSRLSIAFAHHLSTSPSQADSADSPGCQLRPALGGPLHLPASCSAHDRNSLGCLRKIYKLTCRGTAHFVINISQS